MLIKLALRNIMRQKRRTFITVFSIAVGLFVAIVFVGFGDAGYTKMIDMAARLGNGHLVFENPMFRQDPDLKHSIRNTDRIIEDIRNIPEITGYSKRITGYGMLSTSHGTVGVSFDAVAPELDKTASLIVKKIVKGVYFDAGISNSLIIGEKTAKKLNVDTGGKVVMTVQDTNNKTVQQLLKVSGIFSTGSDMIDGFYCQMSLPVAQDMLGMDNDEITQLGVYLNTYRDIHKVKKRLMETRAMEKGEVALLEWSDIMKDLANYVNIDSASNYIFQIMIFMVIGAGVLNTILMSVMERTHEFGVLISIGMDTRKILGLVMIESFFIGILGLISGSILGWTGIWYFKTHPLDITKLYGENLSVSGYIFEPYLSADIFLNHYFTIIVLVLILVVLTGLYPAFKASRIKPVEALHLLT